MMPDTSTPTSPSTPSEEKKGEVGTARPEVEWFGTGRRDTWETTPAYGWRLTIGPYHGALTYWEVSRYDSFWARRPWILEIQGTEDTEQAAKAAALAAYHTLTAESQLP